MATIRRYGPSSVTPAVSPRPPVNRGAEKTFAAFESIFNSANEFIRPAVEQIQTSRGEQEALDEVRKKGPEWGLKQLKGSTSTVAIGQRNPKAPYRATGEWLRYSENFSGKTRSQKINPRLQNALGFLPELGVEMEVFSGGQDAKGSGGKRTGSTRHDHGNAADVRFFKDGRQLSWDNSEDIPVFQEIVRQAKANGVSGFGAGPGYMSPGTMHIGFGSPAVWGAGGKGSNAPAWLREAFGGGPSPTGQGGSAGTSVSVPSTPEYELELLNKSTFEPRQPFTVRDAAFNKAADRVISARATSAMEQGMTAAIQRSNGDLGALKEELEKVRSEVMGQLPKELPGLATELQAQYERGREVATRQVIAARQKEVIAQQSEAMKTALTATKSEAQRLALTGATSQELSAHMAQATDAMAQFGPREGFEIAGRVYPPDPTRAGTMTPSAIATGVASIATDARRTMIEADFMRSDAPGQYVDEFRRQVFSGNSPLPPGESLSVLRAMEASARATESRRRTAAEAERKRLSQEMGTTINAYVQMGEAGVPVAIPAEERQRILATLAPYPEMQREAEVAFQVADAQLETFGMNGPELMAYVEQVRSDMNAEAAEGRLDLGGAAVIESLQDRIKKVQDAVSAETIGLPMIEQLAMDGAASDQVNYDGLREQAAGNKELLTAINEVEAFHQQAEELTGLNAEEREAVLEDARASLATLAARGDEYGAQALSTQKVVDKLAEWSEHRQKMAADDPTKFAQSVGVALPGFEEAQGMADVGAIIGQRVELLAPHTAPEGVENPVPLSQAELDAISEIFQNSPRGDRAAFLGSIADMGEDQAMAIFSRVGQAEPVIYSAGSVYAMGNQQAAGVILRGAVDTKLDGGSATDVASARNSALGDLLEADMLAPEGIKDLDTTALAYARGLAMAEGGRAIEVGDIEEGYEMALGRQADGTGGMVRTSYGVTVLPKGWDKGRVNGMIGSLTNERLTEIAGGLVVDRQGRPFEAEELENTIEQLRPSFDDPYILVPMDADGGVFMTEPAPSHTKFRPFSPSVDAPRDNGDGSKSTEILITNGAPDGGQWNIPSLWYDQQGNPKEVSGREAQRLAIEYERATGNRFPRFDTIESAVDAAKSRSAGGGATAGALYTAGSPEMGVLQFDLRDF